MGINKQELIGKIHGIKGLSNEEKSALIELLKTHKKYGLVWEDKPENVEERLRDELPILTEVKNRAIISKEQDAPNHILIEGDNLEALTALTYTHSGKIDVIYIDPPYNTGNKDFVYNDTFVDSEDSFRHSKWLSFMSRRLKIAHKLLSNTGVIFISIDDNEQSQLKLLCDEIFGERNFVTKCDWRKKTGANDAKDIATITESIMVYTNNREQTLQNSIWNRDESSRDMHRFKFQDEYVETRGRYYLDTLDRGGLQYSDSLNYGIKAPDGGIIYPNGRNTFINDGWIWKWSKEKVDWGIENGFLEFVKSKKSSGSKYTIKYKVYENVDNEGSIKVKVGRAFSNLILEPINQQGNAEMTSIFEGKSPFSNPKPMGLIIYLLKTVDRPEVTILDFFAGSGTTLHATMQLNAEDGGHRKCILVTNNENNICENVTYVRNKRVIQGYTTPKGEDVSGLMSNTLRYYRTDFVPREKTQKNMRALVAAATDMLCIKNDIYTETHEIGGAKMRPSLARHFKTGNNEMLIIYDDRAIPYIVDKLKDIDIKEPIMVYVFSPNDYPYTDEFFEVADKVKLCALPSAIYETYSKVLKRPKPHFLDEEKEKMVETEKEDELDELFTTIDEEGGEA